MWRFQPFISFDPHHPLVNLLLLNFCRFHFLEWKKNNYIKNPPETAKFSARKFFYTVIFRQNYMKNTLRHYIIQHGAGIIDNSEVKKQKDMKAKKSSFENVISQDM